MFWGIRKFVGFVPTSKNLIGFRRFIVNSQRTFVFVMQPGGKNLPILRSYQSPILDVTRGTKRGHDFRPNTYKRIKKHGWETRMRTVNGKATIIRRMIKGISPRKLTH